MRIRYRFNKLGRLKYIGHLDLLNIWNRALKSAGLPVGYSNGFNPHMLLSFAAPLPLGLTSVSEYVDVDFRGDVPPREAVGRLNARFPEGLEATGAYVLTPPFRRIASIVSAAEYLIETPFEITGAQISGFLSQKTIEVMKKTKRNNEMTNILPDIFSVRQSDCGLIARLSCGSAQNLKPTLFMDAFREYTKKDVPRHKISITRTEIYERDTQGGLLPLSAL